MKTKNLNNKICLKVTMCIENFSIRYTVALSLIDGTKILLVGLTVLTNLYTDGALSRTNDFFCGYDYNPYRILEISQFTPEQIFNFYKKSSRFTTNNSLPDVEIINSTWY